MTESSPSHPAVVEHSEVDTASHEFTKAFHNFGLIIRRVYLLHRSNVPMRKSGAEVSPWIRDDGGPKEYKLALFVRLEQSLSTLARLTTDADANTAAVDSDDYEWFHNTVPVWLTEVGIDISEGSDYRAIMLTESTGIKTATESSE